MNLFANTEAVGPRATVTERRDALALDYLTRGKSIDWVLEQVCGDDGKAVAHCLSLAVQHKFITAEVKRANLSARRIDENGRKVR